MNSEILATLEYIEQERGISKEQLIEAVERAILKASSKSIHPASELTVKMDRKTGEIKAWAKLKVVENDPTNDEILLSDVIKTRNDVKVGDVIDWEVTPRNFGRIAAQTARQAILQQLRQAEKEIVQDEFKDQVGEIVNGNVRRIEAGNIIVDFQKAEGIISSKDKVPGEQYMVGDRINAILTKVDIETAGPSLILSRSTPLFVKKLFEREVSEIHDGVVEIVAIAREAGSRSKIAVKSSDPRVDPVGACVGMRGMRVRNITTELGGERVDIIAYSNDLKTYLVNAMHPAKLSSIAIDEDKGEITVHVDEENSRLAFGRKAQNVKLAQRLLQWTINIVVDTPEAAEADFNDKKAEAIKNLAAELGIAEEAAAPLVDNGYLTVEGLCNASMEEIEKVSGISQEAVDAVRKVYETRKGASEVQA